MSTTTPEARLPRPISVDVRRYKAAAPLAALLGLTAALYLWALTRNGYANPYYAAAVQAGTHSWKAFLFGSLDAANYITVDKPPASLWLMELPSRVFGFSSLSMLLPQALEGIAAVALLYATVKRWFGRRAALLSGLVLALTPVAALMFRFNNPDALLVLLLVAGAYALTRALENGSTRWLAFTGGLIGFAFLTKELEAFLVLPAFALAYLVAAPVRLRRRLWQLCVAGGALVLSGGWWVALVELWPAASRPYVGGSTTNNILQLIFGYNGLDRISSGGGGGPGGAGGFSGSAGVLRLFNSILGGQISWLLPAAVVALVAGAVWTARRPRTDRTRAALMVWGGWLVVTAAVYSLMTGVIHPYYTNTLAPAIAVLVGVGAALLWRGRERFVARATLAGMLVATAIWSYVLLDRTPSWHPWLRFAILLGGLAAAAAIIAGRRVSGTLRPAVATVGILAALAGPLAYTLSAVASAETGANPTAGPAVASASGFPGAPRGGGGGRAVGAAQSVRHSLTALLTDNASRYTWVAATGSAQSASSLELATGKSVMAIGGFSGTDPAITLARFKQLVSEGKIHYYVSGGGFGGGPGGAGPGGPPGGGSLGRFGPPPAGGVFPGGFGARGGFPGGGSSAGRSVENQIQSWVSSHFKSETVGGQTVYDLSQPK